LQTCGAGEFELGRLAILLDSQLGSILLRNVSDGLRGYLLERCGTILIGPSFEKNLRYEVLLVAGLGERVQLSVRWALSLIIGTQAIAPELSCPQS
jgi:hypothetical protein